ncbi:MAG: DUF4302 domain-containing protein [Bacteroidales bacterium]|nr:DUF4302 domain-containing protein [Bacteroidales bacterium]
MKRRNIIALLAAAALFLPLQSCLKEQADIFEESASERLQNRMKEASDILKSASNGWVMLIFPVTPTSYSATEPASSTMNGGYAYTVQFDDNMVTAMSERNYTTQDTTLTVAESSYKITNDEGPVLSFDTYNEVLHYWSTPSGSSSYYQGLGGDFEFVINEATSDYIRMTGRRWKTTVEMFPLPTDAESYLKSLLKQKYAMSGIDYGVSVAGEKMDGFLYETNGSTSNTRYIIVTLPGVDGEEGEQVRQPFVVLPDRCRFYEPMQLGDYSFQEFTLNPKTNELKPIDAPDIVFGHPFSYLSKDQYVGNYILTYNKSDDYPELEPKTMDVSIAKDDDGNLVLKGLSDLYDIPIDYDEWNGAAQIAGAKNLGQVSTNNNGFARFCFADSALMLDDETFSTINHFYYRTSKSVMLEILWNEEKSIFRIESHNGWAILSGTFELHLPDGFYLHCWRTATTTSSSADYGALDLASGYGFKTGAKDADGNVVGSRALPFVYSLTRK